MVGSPTPPAPSPSALLRSRSPGAGTPRAGPAVRPAYSAGAAKHAPRIEHRLDQHL